MTLTEHALRGSAIAVGPPHRLPVGLPWFRSTPLSAIVDAELLIDGRPVDGLGLEVDGRTVAVADLGGLRDRYWFVQERLELTWDGPLPERADEAEAVLRLRLHLPFLTGPGGGSVQVLQEVRGTVPLGAAA